MKQYLNDEQTAKLIKLGFESPQRNHIIEWNGTYRGNYSIGELIEILDGVSELDITRFGSGWGVYDELRAFTCEELIDALYDMIIMLKENKVI